MRFLVKLGINLPCDQAIPLPGIHPEKATVIKDTCTLVFIAALFTIARTWKQPRCPSTDELIKMWYVYTMEYYSPIKRANLSLSILYLLSLWCSDLTPVSLLGNKEHISVPPRKLYKVISPMIGFSTNPPSIATIANAQHVWEHGVTIPTFSKLRTSVHALLEYREKSAGIKPPPTS